MLEINSIQNINMRMDAKTEIPFVVKLNGKQVKASSEHVGRKLIFIDLDLDLKEGDVLSIETL